MCENGIGEFGRRKLGLGDGLPIGGDARSAR